MEIRHNLSVRQVVNEGQWIHVIIDAIEYYASLSFI